MRFSFLCVAACFFFPFLVLAQDHDQLVYLLEYSVAKPSYVHVTLRLFSAGDGPLILVMPRAVPGGYSQRPYDPFVENVRGVSDTGAALKVDREEWAPRWKVGKNGDHVDLVEYDVDVARMEGEILSAADSSKIRNNYVGLLGYSVFAFLLGRENSPIRLEVAAPADWTVFSTLAPQVPANVGSLTANASDYYTLADSQIAMGPGLQLRRIDGDSPLFLAVYTETSSDLAEEGKLARDALDKVIAYFGSAPFAHYTVLLEFLRPISPRHEYGFSMEHLDSSTFFFDVNQAITAQSASAALESERFNFAHHMAHSWIPKHAYGIGYLPFQWEMAPVIETIWFNEGFARYAAIEAFAEALPADQRDAYRNRRLDALRKIVAEAPPFLRAKSLAELSRVGSFLYSDDFRVGRNLFARGALMAAEMDDRIRARTGLRKSLRDALRALLAWSDKSRRAFRVEELPGIFRDATGVDVTDILDRWLQPLSN